MEVLGVQGESGQVGRLNLAILDGFWRQIKVWDGTG